MDDPLIYPQQGLFIHRKGGFIHILCETGRLPGRSGRAATATLRPDHDIIVSRRGGWTRLWVRRLVDGFSVQHLADGQDSLA
jgi:hypothetical protein